MNFIKNILEDKQIQELAKTCAQILDRVQENLSTESKMKSDSNTKANTPNPEPKAKDSSPLQQLISLYENLIGAKFQHRRKGTTYILNEILNTQSDDFEKTPVMVTYYDINKKTKWCRPLTEFHSNFSLIT